MKLLSLLKYFTLILAYIFYLFNLYKVMIVFIIISLILFIIFNKNYLNIKQNIFLIINYIYYLLVIILSIKFGGFVYLIILLFELINLIINIKLNCNINNKIIIFKKCFLSFNLILGILNSILAVPVLLSKIILSLSVVIEVIISLLYIKKFNVDKKHKKC